MENANKTRVRFGWCANGGFLEGGGWRHSPDLSANAACVFGSVPARLKQRGNAGDFDLVLIASQLSCSRWLNLISSDHQWWVAFQPIDARLTAGP
jgi:hypothetical protein